MLPVIWTLFAVLAVGGFLMIAAYWLDVQERPDLSDAITHGLEPRRLRLPRDDPGLRAVGWRPLADVPEVASVVPALAVAMFFGFAFGAFT